MDDSDFESCLGSIRRRAPLKDVEVIHQLCINGEIRDFDLNEAFYESLFLGLSICWVGRSEDTEWLLLQIWSAVALLPEYNEAFAITASRAISVSSVFRRLEWGSPKNAALVAGLLAWMYESCPRSRAGLRREVGRWLELQLHQGESIKHAHVQPVLQFLAQIISGMGREEGGADAAPQEQRGCEAGRGVLAELMEKALLPLHLENGMLEWRDQVPIIKPYHESLVLCIVRAIEYEQSLSTTVAPHSSFITQSVTFLMSNWPESFHANTPKEVLFIHELEKLLSMASEEEFSILVRPFLKRIDTGLRHDNAFPLQRTLQCFKNERLVELMTPHLDLIVSELLAPLYRGGELFWNPTVNKMTALVLQKFLDLNRSLVEKHAVRLRIGAQENLSAAIDCKVEPAETKSTVESKSFTAPTGRTSAPRPAPLPMSGPAPKAGMPRGPTPFPGRGLMAGWTPGQGAPPVTVTGVAPWAQLGRGSGGQLAAPKVPSIPENAASGIGIASRQKKDDFGPGDPLECLVRYIRRCKGLPADGSESADDGSIDWLAAQAAPTPTLLPELKFHQLVFGKELGRGAFSIVKYARHIQPNKTRSQWPEYAVKVMSKGELEALGRGFQEAAVREIVALSSLSHPGIARLISAFRYTDCIYLVLEYAAAGDLHSYVMSYGALGHRYTRFVMGEVGAALVSVHDLGLSFNDLKPENILITENGHIKLTDFGACRSINDAGLMLLESKNQQLLGRTDSRGPQSSDFSFFEWLRDGDWKENNRKADSAHAIMDVVIDTSNCPEETAELEGRTSVENSIEGTPGYLPPEVLRDGSFPDQLSDSWAFGCTIEFCLEGRPPFYGPTEQVLHQIAMRCGSTKIKFAENETRESGVHFDLDKSGKSSSGHKRSRRSENKSDGEDAGFHCAVDELIPTLISIDFKARISVAEALKAAYFTGSTIAREESDLMNPLKLHSLTVPPRLPMLDTVLEGGGGGASASGTGDKEWARRQLSSVWAPMPKSYDFSQPQATTRGGVSSRHGLTSPLIVEGSDERHVSFFPPAPSLLLLKKEGKLLLDVGIEVIMEDAKEESDNQN